MQPITTTIPKMQRIQSIDVLRGLVMMIMALDHVRDFFHLPAHNYDPMDFSQTSTAIFLTRWITHFCVSNFVFLAGTSAFFVGQRKGKKALSSFLFTRGLWLIFLEFTVINFGWFFNPHFNIVFLQTIWSLGCSMVALSALIYLPKRWLLVVALLIIFGHNTLDNVHVAGNGPGAFAWSVVHDQRLLRYGYFVVLNGYPILAWIGVMAAGYCFGELYTNFDAAKRKKILIQLGLGCCLLFVVLRFINSYGDPSHWAPQQTTIFTILSFIRVSKYPPSLLYILMTLGPAFLFLACTEKPLNKVTSIVAVFGRVPMFYYILHIYLIHGATVLVAHFSGVSWADIWQSSIIEPISGFGFRLWVVYAIWLSVLIILYPLCKKYDSYKLRNKQKWWLSYL